MSERHDDEYVSHPLYPIFMSALEQLMYGKGRRHGGHVEPFLEQPWRHYAKVHGPGFLTGQAAKKLDESVAGKTDEAYVQELLGAINYIAMEILRYRLP